MIASGSVETLNRFYVSTMDLWNAKADACLVTNTLHYDKMTVWEVKERLVSNERDCGATGNN
jgi:imidazole glycerol phosphate synthase subunit HisF